MDYSIKSACNILKQKLFFKKNIFGANVSKYITCLQSQWQTSRVSRNGEWRDFKTGRKTTTVLFSFREYQPDRRGPISHVNCFSPLSVQIPTSDSPSPPPGLTKPSLVVPISVSDLTARSPFEGAAAESQSLFSDNSNFRHPNPLPAGLPPFPTSSRGSSDWPMTPEPQSLFTSGTMEIYFTFSVISD